MLSKKIKRYVILIVFGLAALACSVSMNFDETTEPTRAVVLEQETQVTLPLPTISSTSTSSPTPDLVIETSTSVPVSQQLQEINELSIELDYVRTLKDRSYDVDGISETQIYLIGVSGENKIKLAYPGEGTIATKPGSVMRPDAWRWRLTANSAELADEVIVYVLVVDVDEQSYIDEVMTDMALDALADLVSIAITRGAKVVLLDELLSLGIGSVADWLREADVLAEHTIVLNRNNGWGSGANHVVMSSDGGVEFQYRVWLDSENAFAQSQEIQTNLDILGAWEFTMDYFGYTDRTGKFTTRDATETWLISLSQSGENISGTLLSVDSGYVTTCQSADITGRYVASVLDLSVQFNGTCCPGEVVHIVGLVDSEGRFSGSYQPARAPTTNCYLSTGRVTGIRK